MGAKDIRNHIKALKREHAEGHIDDFHYQEEMGHLKHALHGELSGHGFTVRKLTAEEREQPIAPSKVERNAEADVEDRWSRLAARAEGRSVLPAVVRGKVRKILSNLP